jgi:hypothetical protein
VTIDTSSTEAMKMCPAISDMMVKKGALFHGVWTLKIFSPHGDRPIASCALK